MDWKKYKCFISFHPLLAFGRIVYSDMRRNSRVGVLPESELTKNVKLDLPVEKPTRNKHGRGFILEYLRDYTVNSNLHGLKYIGEAARTYVERFFWLVMFTFSVVLCGILIRKIWIKWDQSPVIVSFAETSTPVWQIPFPAITICSETKAKQSEYNFTHFYHLRGNMTDEEQYMFEDISLVCDAHLAAVGRLTTNYSTVDNIIRVAPNLSEVFFGCKWKDVPRDTCADLFSPILTEEGLCFTFNTLGADELFRVENLQQEYEYLEHQNRSEGWTLEEGYPEGTTLETYPQRGGSDLWDWEMFVTVEIYGYGARAGLTILLRAYENDLDYLCRGPVQGFKILLHNPAEAPRLSQQYFRAPLSQEVVVAVKPNMMTTSEGLRGYEPTRRQCYFPSERYLQYFKVYTQMNCELECLTNFTYARCGCVQFSMPRNDSMKICSAGSTNCVTKAQMELVTHEITVGLDGEEAVDSSAEAVASACLCLPACTSIEYDAETSQADFDWEALFHSFKLEITEPDTRFARVMIFFKEAQFITSRRSELYGQTDFLANCGGLLGLFMGFSILSLGEIVYFLTLRLCCTIHQRSKRNPQHENSLSTDTPEKIAYD